MSRKYLAWNGEEYPWPPPEGWYEASDDRWWAPNSGPGPKTPDVAVSPQPSPGESVTQITPPQNQSSGFGANFSNAEPVSDLDATSQQPRIDATQNPAPDPQRPQFGATPTQNPTPDPQQPQFGATPTQNPAPGPQQPQFGAEPRAPFGSDPAPNQNVQQPRQLGTGPAHYNSAPESGRSSKLALILAGVVTLVILLGVGIFAVTRGEEDTATVATTASTAPTSATTTIVETTTTAEPTTTTEAVDATAALEGFRIYVTGINIINLADVDLNKIGDEACAAAALAEDEAGWETNVVIIIEAIKAAQIAAPPAAGTPLTDDKIRELYEGATTFYCPAEAERLGISI